MSESDIAISYVLSKEKKLNTNPHDNGGTTNYGISLRFLRSIPPERLKQYGIFETPSDETIINLKEETARKIFYGEFWINAPFAKISNQDHANYIFDMAVNMGINPAIKCVQRACWAVMKNRTLVDDGILGPKTLDAIKMCGLFLMPAMRSERGGYYRLILAHDNDEKEFINGWLNRAYCA